MKEFTHFHPGEVSSPEAFIETFVESRNKIHLFTGAEDYPRYAKKVEIVRL